MENYRGDLADIVRAGGGPISSGSGGEFPGEVPLPDWRFPADPMSYMEEPPVDDFGDPYFPSLRDPLLHELDIPTSAFFNHSNNNSTEMMKTSGVEDTAATAFGGGGGGNIFTRMLQISPNTNKLPVVSSPPCDNSPVGGLTKAVPSPLLVANELITANNNTLKSTCLVENTGMQISSPRNTGIKRRKSQAKKVVCIPAPAPANSRPSTGEVVPSDLWAWRKYGQKPIKGSPYPRGYYRCSSSKGCSARKQVERSRTDPNMLVITYTSEHNHPWPTQRNALAGSTRSQPTKANSGSRNINSTSSSPAQPHFQKGTASLKEEENKEEDQRNNMIVKEEREEELDKEIEMEEDELGFPQSYRPLLPDHCSNQSSAHDQDFFADLGEIEADPLNLLFTQGFSGDNETENNHHKGLEAFTSLFDWTGSNSSSSSSNNNNKSFGES